MQITKVIRIIISISTFPNVAEVHERVLINCYFITKELNLKIKN